MTETSCHCTLFHFLSTFSEQRGVRILLIIDKDCLDDADALRAMESVAEHINEMQKIYEEYGGDFEELVRIEKQERLSYKASHRHQSVVVVIVIVVGHSYQLVRALAL